LKTFAISAPDRLAGLELLVVQDMFLTETAQRADVVLPAASTYEKDGTLTNTAGEVQLTHRSIDPQGPRSDFDLIRILSHQLGMLGLGSPIKLRTAGSGIRRNSPERGGLQPFARESAGGRLGNRHRKRQNAESFLRRARGHGFSSNDYLFTSGTLGRYCSKLTSTNEAKDKPWSSSDSSSQHPVLVVSLVKIAVLLFVVMTALAYLTWFERKVVARIQSRWGPYYVGAHGLLQPLADGVKFLFKEDMTPPTADKFTYTIAPFLALMLALTAIALIPFGSPDGPYRCSASRSSWSRTWISGCFSFSRSRRSAFTAWRSRAGLPTANIRCSAACAARRRWSATKFRSRFRWSACC
jgi:hypothetical protein